MEQAPVGCRGGAVAQIVYRSDPDAGLSLMIEANLRAGEVLEQRPFAIVLGCADARVPIELVFGLDRTNSDDTRQKGGC